MVQQSEALQLSQPALGTGPVDPTGGFVEWLMAPEAPPLEELDRHPDWQERASCRGEPAEVFFPGESGDYVRARAICGVCRVRAQCLEYALTPPFERHGFWGGATERERQKMRRRAA